MNAVWDDLGRSRRIRPRAPPSRPSSPRRSYTRRDRLHRSQAVRIERARSVNKHSGGRRAAARSNASRLAAEAVDRLAALYDAGGRGRCARRSNGSWSTAFRRATRCARVSAIRELRVTYQPEGVPPVERARLRQVHRARRLFDDGDPARGFSRLSARAARAAGRRIRRRDRGRRRRRRKSLTPTCSKAATNWGAAARPLPSSRASFPCPRSRWSATRSPTARSKSAPASSARSRCSTRRASTIRCAGSSITPAPTGARCSRGCC